MNKKKVVQEYSTSRSNMATRKFKTLWRQRIARMSTSKVAFPVSASLLFGREAHFYFAQTPEVGQRPLMPLTLRFSFSFADFFRFELLLRHFLYFYIRRAVVGLNNKNRQLQDFWVDFCLSDPQAYVCKWLCKCEKILVI